MVDLAEPYYDLGAQRPVQVDHGACGGRDAHIVAAGPAAGACVSCGAAPPHGCLARTGEYAHYTTRSTGAVYGVAARGAVT